MKKAEKRANPVVDALVMAFGAALFAAATSIFIIPNNFAPGGVTGIAIISNHLLRTPVGMGIVVMNIPLFILGLRKLGMGFVVRTAFATATCSLLIDVFSVILPAYTENKMLASIYGGVLGGAGLALVILRGGTTGGTDILARLLNRKFRHLSLGRVIFLFDLLITLCAVLAFGYIEAGLYSVITIFASSRVIDAMLYGADMGKSVMIISQKSGEISSAIARELERGVTLLDAKGAYTGKKSELILCAVRNNEVGRVHRIALAIDSEAFIIVTEAGEIIGEGFKSIDIKQ